MRPLRRKKTLQVIDDLLTGKERVLAESKEIDLLSDEGSIDTVARQRLYFSDCGCNKPPAGRCVECGAISCAECHGRCCSCGSPLCLRHSVFVDGPQGSRVRWCAECFSAAARRARLRKVGRILLGPFVDFGGQDRGKA